MENSDALLIIQLIAANAYIRHHVDGRQFFMIASESFT